MKEFTEGFLLQASLIFALGAQNIFVLESGLRKQRQFLVASLCSLCDVILITLGVVGAVWFFGLSIFTYAMTGSLNRPSMMKLISFVSGAILIVLSFKLGLDVHFWMNGISN